MIRHRPRALHWFLVVLAAASVVPLAGLPSRAAEPGPAATRAPLGGSPRPLKLPSISDTKLPNGLLVRIVEDHRFPLVNIRLAFPFGTTSDPADLPGLAASTASLLDEGTAGRSSSQIANELASIGGGLSAAATVDSVIVFGSSLSEFVPRLVALMADTSLHPSFPESEVALRKENLSQELAQNRAQPSWLARERFAKEIYGSSPYAVVSATEASIAKLTRESIASFHKRMFVPAGAVLVVVGDVKAEAALKEIASAFGSWKGEAVARPAFPDPPARTARGILLVDRPGSVQSDITVGTLGIRRKDPLYFPALMLDGIVGGGAASRLFLIVREEKGYAYDAHSELRSRQTSGDWAAVTQVRTEVTKPALEEVLRQLERMKTETVSEAELTAQKNYAVGIFTLQVERAQTLAGLLADQKIFDLPADDLETYVAKINAVTPDDVRKVAARFCDTSRAAIVVVGDATKIRGDLAPMGPLSVFDTEGARKEPAR